MIKFPFSRTLKDWVAGRQIASTLNATGWQFSPFRAKMIADEISNWQAYYLPIDLSGKIVLDVGAGEGETAKFFLEHGAKEVICIEPDKDAFHNLLANSKRFRGITPVNEAFELKHLFLKHDFLKMDIEGYEDTIFAVFSLMCDYDAPVETVLKPSVIEVHGLHLRDRFANAGFQIIYSSEYQKKHGCQCYAYWRCKP